MHDPGGIGNPTGSAPPPDEVGPARFRYHLGHVALHRRQGRWSVVAARGVADVGADGVVTLAGLSRPEGGRLALGADTTDTAYDVTAGGAEQITVAGDRRPTGCRGPGRRRTSTSPPWLLWARAGPAYGAQT